MRSLLKREWFWGIAAVAVLAAVWFLNPGNLADVARETAFERLGEALPRSNTSESVVIIDIDRESLAEIGPWPWRRSQIAALIERAGEAAPAAIAIDVLLSGADRRGPAALADELSQMSEGAPLDLSAFENDDQRLAAAIAAAGNVVLGILLDNAGDDAAPLAAPFAVEGSTAGIVPRASTGLVAPHRPFSTGAAGIGVLSFEEGLLGRVASAPVVALAGQDAFPGFAVEAVRVAEGASTFILKTDPDRLDVGSFEVPLDANAEMRLYRSSADVWPSRTVPAWTMLSGTALANETFADKIVVLGSSAPEAGAFLPVAGSALVPTVQIQADAIDQILAQSFLTRPPQALPFEIGAMLVLGLAAIALAIWLPPAPAALGAIAIAAAWIAAVAFAFARYGMLFDPIGPAVSAILAANVTEIASFIRTRALKTAIVQRFERYVPPEVVARLVREPETLRLDGELREVTALLTDVEGFSRMTENTDPRALVRVLDAYFDQVTELVVAHGGMVDKIVGDAVLAFFNIPAPLQDHPVAAVRCARAILAATETFRHSGEPAALAFGRTRAGIESGVAIVGDVGGRRRLDYTAYGVVVNKAARFQDANKTLKSSICIGPAAAEKLNGAVPLRPLGRIQVRGMVGLSDVFEPWADDVPDDARQRYAKLVEISETDWPEARRGFEDLAERFPNDPVIAMWRERLLA